MEHGWKLCYGPTYFHAAICDTGLRIGLFLPLAYVLLQRKTQTSYEVMFRILEEHGCDPSTVLIDFEKSVENALHSVFGPHVLK